MKEITYKDILLINQLCLFSDEPFLVTDENRVRSALGNQFAPYDRDELSIASVYKSLVINHGFMNGNKRTAVIALYLFSKMIDNPIKINDQELASFTYRLADEGGSLIDVNEISDIVFKNNNHEVDKDIDIKNETTKFIKEHEWLMKELGK